MATTEEPSQIRRRLIILILCCSEILFDIIVLVQDQAKTLGAGFAPGEEKIVNAFRMNEFVIVIISIIELRVQLNAVFVSFTRTKLNSFVSTRLTI